MVKMQQTIDHGVPSPSFQIYTTTSTPKAQGTLTKRGRKIVRASRSCLLYTTSGKLYSGIQYGFIAFSTIWLPKQHLINDNTAWQCRWEKSLWVLLYMKSFRHSMTAERKRIHLLQGWSTSPNWLSHTKWSTLVI